MPPGKTQQPNTNGVRRSQRLFVSTAVVVSGESDQRVPFRQETRTVVVSPHGALVLLGFGVSVGQLLTLRNPKTNEERRCRVVDVNASKSGDTQVGVEFVEPSPQFWRVAFPPVDWTPRSEEAKRYDPSVK